MMMNDELSCFTNSLYGQGQINRKSHFVFQTSIETPTLVNHSRDELSRFFNLTSYTILIINSVSNLSYLKK